MRVEITIVRTYEMNEARVLAEPDFDPPSPDASEDAKRAWLRESFYELCGWSNERDHVDGEYVWLVEEDSDDDFQWSA